MRFVSRRGFTLSLFAVLALGCRPPDSAHKGEQEHMAPHDQANDHSHDPSHEHDHEGTDSDEHHHGSGPHGGVIADLGGGVFHAEFTVDHAKQEVTVYILGSDAKTPAPIDAKQIQVSILDPLFDIELAAKPLDGEPSGRSSRFSVQHANFGIVREFEGTIVGVADGVPYAGEFKE